MTSSKLGTKPYLLQTSVTVLLCSGICVLRLKQLYACEKVNIALNETCRSVTGCLKIDNELANITLSDTRRDVEAKKGR